MPNEQSGKRILLQVAGLLVATLVLCAGCGGNGNPLADGGLSAEAAAREAQKSGDRPVSIPEANPLEGGVPLEVHFWGEKSYDPDGTIVKWEWNFGDQLDGTSAWQDYTDTGGAATHTYEHPGTQVAHLRVTDNDGNTDVAFVKVKMRNDGGPGDPPEDPPGQAWPMFGYAAQHIRRSPFVGAQTSHLLWRFNLGASQVISSPAVAADGTIYVGSMASTNKLFAVNPDGTQKWAFSTEWSVRSSPAIGPDGTVYVGCDDNSVYAVNPDGSLKWSFVTDNDVLSSPTIGPDGTIYVGSFDRNLYALNPDGSEKWSYPTGNWVYSSPAIGSDGTVYVGSDDYRLHAVNPDGSGKWTYLIGNKVRSSPTVGPDGTIYVGSLSGKLFAVNADGSLKWQVPTGGAVYSSPGLAADGTIYIGIMSFSSAQALLAFNSDGSLKWQSFTMSEGIYSSPTVGADGTIYVGCQNGRLYAVNPDGTALWSYPCGGDVDASPAIGPDGTVYVSSLNLLYAFGPSI